MQAMFPIPESSQITGLILAGGQARRLGGQDKGLIQLGNKTLIEHVIKRLEPQLKTILINANRHQHDYQQFGLAVIADSLPDFAGPLAGILSGLQNMQTEWLLSVPCDNPWLPTKLVATLIQASNEQPYLLAVACCEKRLQPVYCLLHRSLHTSLAAYLENGQHKVQDWIQQQVHCVVDFPDAQEFENINTPEQLAEAEKRI